MDITAVVLCSIICFTVMVCVSTICKAAVDCHEKKDQGFYSTMNDIMERIKKNRKEGV